MKNCMMVPFKIEQYKLTEQTTEEIFEIIIKQLKVPDKNIERYLKIIWNIKL